MAELGQAAADIIDMWARDITPSVKWDAFDLIDGRLYLRIYNDLRSLSVDQDVAQEVGVLAALLKTLSGVDISKKLPQQNRGQKQQSELERDGVQTNDPKESSYVPSTVLPFSHPVMDRYLQQVHLTLGEDSEEQGSSQIFRELTHWHNAKKLADSRRQPNGIIRKKNINPEIIVVHQSDDIKKPKTTQEPGNDWRATLKGKQAAKNKKHQRKSGKQKGLEAAQALKENKAEEKSAVVVSSWKKRTLKLEKEKSLTKRYLKAERYFRGLSPLHVSFVGAETSLYLCHILNMMRNSNGLPKSSVSGVTAILWSQLIETNRLPLTLDVNKQLLTLAKTLNIPLTIGPASSPTSGALPFTINGTNSSSTKLAQSWEFQLEHCRPYMERSFQSAPDPRVPFHPDAWQRKVLDAIDADKSLFVVAPTSSGKTFISFYAMKKVLQANDDDILVYVAPTKALVNQIAAEVQARFSKSYRHDGRSVWAIHTLDHKVNNPNGCQVLVTVPHILQIMLLAPSNAKGPNSWSRKLLLLAPCPIIALSATVGNPDEFKGWLSDTQKVKGFDLEMITHGSRYSDLRKFTYEPPKLLDFQGLGRVERLPLPGLDSGSSQGERFAFIHPVWSLVRRDLTSLEDTSFEPRDCLTLWRSMQKHSNRRSEAPKTLHPQKCLPEIISKADVVEWESTQSERPSPYFSLVLDLRSSGALPAIVFNFDRMRCESIAADLFQNLERVEDLYREGSEWKAEMAEFERWKKANDKIQAKSAKQTSKQQSKDDEGLNKLELLRDKASQEDSPWKSFNPDDPIVEFRLADDTKISKEELDKRLGTLEGHAIKPVFIKALRRGIGVHHAGMNRQYRQVVEMLFRKGYLTIVIATGTLALGINMPSPPLGDGVPLNFAGLVGHLYYTENAAFAFHSLLKEGYFHKLEKVVKPSPSVVILPELPKTAAQILKRHNKDTLQIFQGYVSTYVAQHLSRAPDNELPFTKRSVEALQPRDMREMLSPLPATIRASPFAALSGFTDEFETIGELCRHVRGGVFLEESAIPYIPVAPAELGGVPWNAYIYDFFKHGDLEALIRDNGILRIETEGEATLQRFVWENVQGRLKVYHRR
ncbi:hypothetical protein DL763_004869 [Monosporascus cannonballus]|nr:hypothetical protein DL763_004869 [Monosporascus cannonballus]